MPSPSLIDLPSGEARIFAIANQSRKLDLTGRLDRHRTMDRLGKNIPEIGADRILARRALQGRFSELGFSVFSQESREKTFALISTRAHTDIIWTQKALELIIDYVGLGNMKIEELLDDVSLRIFYRAEEILRGEALRTRSGLFTYGSSRHREAFEKILGSLTVVDRTKNSDLTTQASNELKHTMLHDARNQIWQEEGIPTSSTMLRGIGRPSVDTSDDDSSKTQPVPLISPRPHIKPLLQKHADVLKTRKDLSEIGTITGFFRNMKKKVSSIFQDFRTQKEEDRR